MASSEAATARDTSLLNHASISAMNYGCRRCTQRQSAAPFRWTLPHPRNRTQ